MEKELRRNICIHLHQPRSHKLLMNCHSMVEQLGHVSLNSLVYHLSGLSF